MSTKISEPFKHLEYFEGKEKWYKSFERMCSEILHIEYNKDTVIRLDGSGGDDGIDVMVKSSDNKISIYQCKFYTNTFHEGKIRSSFLTAFDKNKEKGFKKWVLVIPKTLTKRELSTWDKFTEEYKSKGIEFEMWDEDKIVFLLKKNRLYDSYFLNNDELQKRELSSDTISRWQKKNNIFEETSVYLKSYDMLQKNNVLVISGKSQSGKTAIVQNICCSIVNQDDEFTVLSVDLNDFKYYANSSEFKRIYVFDDVFGVKEVEDKKIDALSEKMLSFLNEAIKSGSKVIFTSRDYILNKVIDSKAIGSYADKFPQLLNEQNIINIDIDTYSLEERRNIILKHVNASSIQEEKKFALKTYSNKIIQLDEFTPELIRRLVDNELNKNIEFNWPEIESYFKNPVDYLLSLFSDLDKEKRAALLLMLLNEGQLPTSFDEALFKNEIEMLEENVDHLSIKKALTYVPDILIKQEIIMNRKVWKFHHPSIEEALVEYIINDVKKNDFRTKFFINAVDFRTLIENTTTRADKKDRIFISEDLWRNLSIRLFKTFGSQKGKFDFFKDSYLFKKEALVRFFAWETNDGFLKNFNDQFSNSKDVWKDLVSKSVFNQLYNVGSFELAYRLDILGLLSLESKNEVIKNIQEVAKETFDVSFLEERNIEGLLGEKRVVELLEYYKNEGLALAEVEMYDLINEDIDLSGDAQEALDSHFATWYSSLELLREKLSNSNLLSTDLDCKFNDLLDELDKLKEEFIEEQEIENEESVSLDIVLLEEFIRKAIHSSPEDDFVQLINECVTKMVTDLSYDHENAVIYIGNILNSEEIKGHEVIINLRRALHQYIEDNTK